MLTYLRIYIMVKATEIKLDIIKGCFDPTLEKYKPEIIVKSTAFKQVEIQSTAEKAQSPTLLHELVTQFSDWCNNSFKRCLR